MAILSINVNVTGLVGETVNPRRNTMISTDSLATITAAGYINGQNSSGNPILPTDIFEVLYSFNQQTKVGTFGIFTVSYNINTGFTLTEWTNPGNVLLPVTSGHLASFNGTNGQIQDSGVVAANVLQTTAVNTMGAGGEIILDKGTGTVNTGAVTINKQAGVITEAVSTTAGSTTTFTLTNSEILANSVLLVSLMGGSNTTIGVQLSAAISAPGSATISISNNNASAALNGNLLIGFVVL